MRVVTERDVEVPWAVAYTVAPTLDVGCAESTYIDDLCPPIDGIDVRPIPPDLPLRRCYHDDIRTANLPDRYRTVLAISTVEHVGLAHEPYGTHADDVDKGDRHAVEGCMRAVEPGGRLLMSVPFGCDACRGWYRIYSDDTLAALLDGYAWQAEYHLNAHWAVGGVALVTVAA